MSEHDGWRFCPRCAADIEHQEERVLCPACGLVHYGNSEPTASALCVDERGRVLLARRAIEPFEGYWDLPGGFLQEGEHPLDTIRRELLEETGLEVEPIDLLGIWIDRYAYASHEAATLNLFWTARVLGGSAAPADDVSELGWFHPDDFPPDDELAFQIGDVLRTWRNEHA
jgi:8-oxo-dGTP diphosphatase